MRGSIRLGLTATFVTCALVVGCGPEPTVDAGADAAPSDVPAAFECATDDACSDGTFCNGSERCRPGAVGADERGCVPAVDVTPCLAGQTCDETAGACVTDCEVTSDADGDGAEAIVCGGTDCDDARDDVLPGATEICDPDDVDEDCDPSTFGVRDLDGDLAPDALCCNADASLPSGVRCGTDCDDGSAARRPGADEVCDDHDDDCDGGVDETVQVMGFLDLDGDLHGDPAAPVTGCLGAPGTASVGDDCDDTDVRVHRGQIEICDMRDNDCDAMVDEDARTLTWYRDADGDGFGSASAGTVVSCVPPDGHSLLGTDCDDDQRAVSPIAPETCNGRDDDCNGVADFRIGASDFEDDDGDGAADLACPFVGTDCDDRDPFTAQGATEICDARDNDCDANVDEDAVAQDWLADDDHDGFGDPTDVTSSCAAIAGRVLRTGDCDDTLAAVHPLALDACGAGEGRDDDCDTRVDEAGARAGFYVDGDGDGFGAGDPVLACSAPSGRIGTAGDCDDGSSARNPGADELCSGGVDDDCDGATDCMDGSCTLATVCEPTGTPALTVAGGDGQSATVTHALDLPIELVLTDGDGHPVRGATVTVAGPGNSFWYPTATRTDALGRAQFIAFVGRTPGPYRWTFTTAGASSVSVDATATPAADGEETRPVDAADTGDRPTVLPAASVGVSLGAIRGSGYLPDGRIVVADDDLGCILQITSEGIASALAGRCRLSGMGGLGLSCTPSGDGGPAINATFCDIDAMLVDATRGRLWVVDLAHGQLRRIDLSTGRVTLVAGGTTPVTASSGAVPIASAQLRGPFLPATLDPAGDIVFAQSVLGTGLPIELYRYDVSAGTIAIEAPFIGEPAATPYLEQLHVEPLGLLPGPSRGGLQFQGELCIFAKSSPVYSIDVIDTSSGRPVTRGCGAAGPAVGALDSTTVPDRVTALGLDATGNAVYAVAGTGAPAAYHIDVLSREVTRLPLTSLTPVRAIGARGTDVLLLATDETVVEIGGVGSSGTTATTVATSPTTLTAPIAGRASVSVRTTPGLTDVSAVATTPGGGSVPTVVTTNPSGDGSLVLTAGWRTGAYDFAVGPVDLFGGGRGGASFRVNATAPAAGTLLTLLGTPWYLESFDPDYRLGYFDEAATSLAISQVVGVEILPDGTTYVAVSGDAAGLWRVTPAGVATRLGLPDAYPAPGPLSTVGFSIPLGLELDAATNTLYVAHLADTDLEQIWQIDLTTDVVSLFAGDPMSTTFDDGTDRLDVALLGLGHLALGPDGRLYFPAQVSDISRAGVRFIDPATDTIGTLLAPQSSTGCGTINLYECLRDACSIDVTPTGDVFVAGRICGSAPACGTSRDGGVLQRTPSGTLVHVAGRCGGTLAPGSLPTATRMPNASGVLWLSSTEILVGAYSGTSAANYLWRVPLDGRPTSVVAGIGTQADYGDPRSGPATSTPVREVRELVLRPDGRVVFADDRSVRMVW